MFAVIVGIVLLALVVVARNSSTTSRSSTVTPAPAASTSAEATPAQTEAAPAATSSAVSEPSAGHDAPTNIVAHYTASGVTVFWNTPAAATDITGYNVEIRVNSGEWMLVSTTPASQLSLDVAKSDSASWTQFRVSTVYKDGTVVGGKVFGIPGTYK